MQHPRAYLAGPDVFEPNPIAVGEVLKAKCSAAGIQPLYPMDNQVPAGTLDVARFINDANVAMIRSADIVLANLNPFRGPEPDSGTVFEIGLACGLGKPVFGYVSSAESLADRVIRMQDLPTTNGRPTVDQDGMTLEDFGHPQNLMLVYGVTQLVIGNFDDALAAAQAYLEPAPVAEEVQSFTTQELRERDAKLIEILAQQFGADERVALQAQAAHVRSGRWDLFEMDRKMNG